MNTNYLRITSILFALTMNMKVVSMGFIEFFQQKLEAHPRKVMSFRNPSEYVLLPAWPGFSGV